MQRLYTLRNDTGEDGWPGRVKGQYLKREEAAMELTTRQHMIRTMEQLPDEAIEEMATFVAYLHYKYRVSEPDVHAPSNDDAGSWMSFLHVMRQIQQGPWESEQTMGDILSTLWR